MPGIQKNSKQPRISSSDSTSGGSIQSKLSQYFTSLSCSPSFKNLTNSVLSEHSGVSPTTKTQTKRKLSEGTQKNGKRLYQPVIDANQRSIGPQTCPVCAFCGDCDHEEDKKVHDAYHSRFLREKVEGESSDFSFSYGDSEPEIALPRMISKEDFPDLKFVAIHSKKTISSNPLVKKTRAILAALERQIDSTKNRHLSESTDLVLLVVNVRDKKVVGCLAAEKIVHEDTFAPDAPQPTGGAVTNLPSLKAFCGVYLLWVAPQHRHRKLATFLVNHLRENYMRICYLTGKHMEIANLAFSEPTSQGMAFIRAYTGGGQTCRIYRKATVK